MNIVIISVNQTRIGFLKEVLKKHKILVYSSFEELRKHIIQKDSYVFIDLDSEEETMNLEEYLNNQYKLIIFYYKNHYPFEQHSDTIFLPDDSDDESILAAMAKIQNTDYSYDTHTDLIGSSLLMESVRMKIQKWSHTKEPIHISGNTGTGKNVAARRIHKLSGLKSKMVYINCGAYSNPSLMEGNFFGCTKGAYTGATYSRNGFLKSANKSILFLDEIENMTFQMQEMLLDVIESGKFMSLGSDTEVSSDFRLITASNVPLEQLTAKGVIRKDFSYRIAHRILEMPDLDNHKEDIPDLVNYYEKTNNIIRYRVKSYDTLYNHSWPGNIRELFTKLSQMHEENYYADTRGNRPIYCI